LYIKQKPRSYLRYAQTLTAATLLHKTQLRILLAQDV
jgi:hypothetical protein